jgi:hypothetical protein
MNITGTLNSCYMTYTNVFDCITSTEVRIHVFTCVSTYRIFSSTNECQNLQVTWQPYETNEVEGMALNAICKRDQELWRAELPLICYYIVK